MRRPRGLSLPDTLLSLVLLSLTVGVTASFLPVSWVTAGRAEHRLHAVDLADSRLEQLRTEAFRETPPWLEEEGEDWNGLHYTVRAGVAAVPGYDPALLRRITVVVSWPGTPKNGSLSYELWVAAASR